MDGREIKIKKFFLKGNAVIVACDHGEFDGPIPGMVNIGETVSKINKNVDGVLLSPAMIRHTGDYFTGNPSPSIVGRLNWNTVYCFHWKYNESVSTEAFSPEEALALGVEIALVSLTLKTGSERTDAKNVKIFRSLVAECRRLGMPVIGEYFPAHSGKLNAEEMHEQVKIGCRIIAELGADMIKTFYTCKFKEVAAGCPVPILALGAEKLPAQIDALNLAEAEIKNGAKGVVFGRNAIQVPDPAKFQAALIDVVKNNVSAKDAEKKHHLRD